MATASRQTPQFELQIEGSPAPPEVLEAVIRISVRLDLNLSDAIELQLSNKDLQFSESDTFAEGKKISLKLGYVETGIQLVASGVIARREFVFPERGPAVVTVVAYDKRVSLKQAQKTRAWKDVKDSDIVTELCQAAGFTADVDPTSVTHPYMFQRAGVSDLAFIQERSRLLGYVVHVDPEGKKLSFKQFKPTDSSSVTLDWGQTLFSFRPRFSSSGQLSNVSVRGWSPAKKQSVTASATTDDVATLGSGKLGAANAQSAYGSREELFVHFPVNDATEAKDVATSFIASAAIGYARADGSCQGDATILPGAVIKIGGVGARASGDYVISSVTQHFDTRGFTTYFECMRPGSHEPPPPPPPPPPAAGAQQQQAPPPTPQLNLGLRRPGTVVVSMRIDPDAAKSSGDTFVLSSDDGTYTQTKKVSDALDADTTDDRVEIAFSGCDPTKTYSLQINEPGSDPVYLFKGVPYDGIAGWKPPGDSGSS
ncbi:MAG TPA: hypothetical protein VFF73_33545 [Planctomycetota bacterium]|nr:hypothetical protein [Planctomycetota bacterium]